MERKQIYLSQEQIDALNQVAYERKVTTSLVIRDAVAQYLTDVDEPILETAEEHPLWGIIGMVDSPDAPADGSVSHDEVVYRPPRRRRQR